MNRRHLPATIIVSVHAYQIRNLNSMLFNPGRVARIMPCYYLAWLPCPAAQLQSRTPPAMRVAGGVLVLRVSSISLYCLHPTLQLRWRKISGSRSIHVVDTALLLVAAYHGCRDADRPGEYHQTLFLDWRPRDPTNPINPVNSKITVAGSGTATGPP